MPRRMKKSAPRRRPAKKQARRARKVRNVSEYASLSEVRQMTAPGGSSFTTKALYSLTDTSLSQFTRAQNVAKAYQHYRIKYIQVKVLPNFDNYFAGNPAGPSGKPQLYFMIDKSGALPTNPSLEALRNMGAKPRALDEHPLKFGWRPSVLEATMTAGGGAGFVGQGARYQISPWLNTNANSVNPGAWVPSNVDHLGVYWFVDQPVGAPQPYQVEVEVQFEFKKPFIAGLTSSVHALPAVPAVINNSPDGIVDMLPGGDDTFAPSS